jgi:UDP-N-acetylglucosamine/UDP-N-acetyl-alpha-D-glucosaminouronate 4-epimerase
MISGYSLTRGGVVPDLKLVTGGAGFIGSHLVRRLLAEGADVRVLDDFSTGSRANLEDVARDIEILEGDVRDLAVVARAVAGCSVVFHEAALGSVPRSVADPLLSHEVNATGTLNVLVAARDAGVARVVYASSSSVYGDAVELPKRESATPKPLSPYALSKLTAEQACGIFTRLYGLETVALRYFNVFGPRQDPASQYAAVIPRFATVMLAGERPVIFGDGFQSRDFTYVDDVIEANMLAATASAECAIGEGGGVYNVACGGQVTLLELVAELNRSLATALEPVLAPERAGDIKHSRAAIERAGEFLGFEPRTCFRDGIDRTVQWFRRERPTPAAFAETGTAESQVDV